MPKFAFGVVALALLVAGCKPSAEEIEREVSTHASVSASLLVGALRSCRLVGVASVDDCVGLRGKLVQEVAAQAVAEAAVENRNAFWKACQSHYHQAYCQGLLQRAAEISARTPSS